MKPRSQDDYIRTALRVPPDLHAKIHEAARDAGRTFNAEILNRLEVSFSAFDKTVENRIDNLVLGAVHRLADKGVIRVIDKEARPRERSS